MPLYLLHYQQNIPISPAESWEFISNPNNLALITPAEMNFRTISDVGKKIYAGQIIEYKVSPVLGISMNWVTEITHVDEGNFFVDEQRYGPYAFWHHKHFITEIPGGSAMIDTIHYKIPFGIFGKMAHPFLVKPQLEKIFEFRKSKLIEKFGPFNV